jgi:hypothetical protein
MAKGSIGSRVFYGRWMPLSVETAVAEMPLGLMS